MHAGCKVIPVNGGEKTALIVGLSGPGFIAWAAIGYDGPPAVG